MDMRGHNGGPKANNWVAIDRDMRFHPIVGFLNPDGTPRDGRQVSETDAWVDMICEAGWKDREVNNMGKVMLIERGQLMHARSWYARRWGWSEDKVRWWISKLEKAGMVIRPQQPKHTQSKPQRNAHYINVITLCNYNIYQTLTELDAHLSATSNTQSTPNQHPEANKDTRKQDRSPNGDSAQLALEPEKPKMTASLAAREAFVIYNETAERCGLATARTLSDSRKRALALRVKEAGGLDGFRKAMDNLERSAFLRGNNDRGWRADIDFICQPSSFMRLFEGGYGNGAHAMAESYSRGNYAGKTI